MLEHQTIGVIGAGNMGGAILKGLLAAGTVRAQQLRAYDEDRAKLDALAQWGVAPAKSAPDLAAVCDIVILAVKPGGFPRLLGELGKNTSPLFLSIAAGVTIAFLKSFLGEEARVIRVMPNTPALVGEGATVLSAAPPASDGDLANARAIFEGVGIVEVMDERYMDAVVAVSGSSPAYVYMLIEAMADAAVAGGISRDAALRLAAQSVLGSAKLVLESSEHPAELRDRVCSPGGTTIRAVQKLEEHGFKNAVHQAMDACTKRSKELSADA